MKKRPLLKYFRQKNDFLLDFLLKITLLDKISFFLNFFQDPFDDFTMKCNEYETR